MFICKVSFWDGNEGRYYEEGNIYPIDVNHMKDLKVLNRFEEIKAEPEKVEVKKIEKVEEKPKTKKEVKEVEK